MDQKSRQILEFDKVLHRLAEHTSFTAGEALALRLSPSNQLSEVIRWQTETQEARTLFERQSEVTIGGARDIRRAAANAQRGYILDSEDFLTIRTTVISARDLRRKLIKVQETYPHLAAIAELIEDCPGLVSSISNTLDERGEVLDSASPKLAEIRRKLRVVHGRIQDKLHSLLGSELNQFLQEPTITTRGGRYVVPLQANYKGRIRGIVHDQSNSGATLWIEPINTVELNNEYRGLQLAESDEIQRILAELSTEVAIHGDALKRMVERVAELDLIFARARYANSLDAVMPEMVQWHFQSGDRNKVAGQSNQTKPPINQNPGSTIWIRGARHPLLDPATVVPTDVMLEADIFIVLITGPNTGGKTVSLKTIGLMVLMAQSGLHLPAVNAKLTVFSDVFADIGDEQSIEQNLSTFSGHLTNIIRILNRVDDRKLVLLDELGSGTDPAEGAALAQAIVSFLRDKGATTFVATHFPELKVYASQTPGATNASLLFDIETLMPTYEMSIGMPGRSNAFAIARRLGLDETILDQSLQLVGSSSYKAEALLDSIYEIREKISSQEAGARYALKQAEGERSILLQRLENIEAERQKILTETRHEAEAEIERVRDEIRLLRKKIRDASSVNRLKKLQKETEQIEEQLVKPIAKQLTGPLPPKPSLKASDLDIGDTVMVTSLGVKGQIVNVGKYDAEVAVGRLHMRTQFNELELKSKAKDDVDEPAQTSSIKIKAISPGFELDIRGKRVDEGLQILEQHIDSAFLASLPWIRIIHGKGTGRLRQAVREALEGNSHVQSWEEGGEGEGGPGVTVAKLAIE